MSAVTPKKIHQSEEFRNWLRNVRDPVAKAAIDERIERIKNGNFGDVKALADAQGLYEIRVDVGQGYRVYFMHVGGVIVLLLLGGDKSTQKTDPKKAKKMLDDIKERNAAAKKRREEEERLAAKAAEKARQSNNSKRK